MPFSKSKMMSLKPQKGKWLSAFLLAFAVASAMFIPYMLLGQGYFIFYGDFNVQQIPFYTECHRAVRAGEFYWNSLTDLGANFIGSYSFYLLGSPFFWLTIPFPTAVVPYLMGPLLILKFSLASLSGYAFIRRFVRTPEAALLGGLLYAFSGFSVYNIFFNHFHEAIIFFPLLLLSLELLITENKRGIFALMVAVCAVSNYFFFFGMVVFSVIYFFVRLFSGALNVRVSRFFVLLFEAVLGVGISAVLLLPSLSAIIGNGRVDNLNIFAGWNGIMYGKEQIYLNIIECFFFPPDLPARPVFFPEADVKWSSLGGWLPFVGMTGVFVWFINKKKTWQRRLLGICIFMAMVPVLNSAFYAFNTSYYARWFYMPILIMCLVTATVSEDSETDWKEGFGWSFGITAAFAAAIGFFPKKTVDASSGKEEYVFGLFTKDENNIYMYRFWVSVIIALLSLLVLRLIMMNMNRDRTAFIRRSVAFVCIFSALYGNIFVATGQSHSYEIEDVVIDTLIEGEVNLSQKGDYRIDVYDGVDNTGMFLGLESINAFHSIVPVSVMEFYEFVGEERSVASRPSTDNEALRSLLAVKYVLNPVYGDGFVSEDGETVMSGYKYLRTDGGYYIYENQNFVPYGVTYKYYMTKEYCENFNADMRANLMLKAVILDDEQIKKYGKNMQNLETVTMDYYSDSLLEETEDLVSLSTDSEEMARDSERLRETAARNFVPLKNGFDITVEREEKSLVYLQIPYDEGWSAEVNGKKAEIERVNIGFMAVEVPSGVSKIILNYETPALATGFKVTVVSAGILAVYLLVSLIFRKKLNDKTVYPEGEALIKMWRRQEINAALKTDEDKIETPRSILDEIDEGIPEIPSGIKGGFTVDKTAYDDDGDR